MSSRPEVLLAQLRLLVYGRAHVPHQCRHRRPACAEVMRRYRLRTKREAVNFALRAVAAEPLTVDEAVALYRQCRRQGEIARKLNDCFIGAVAIRANAPVLHNDKDFAVPARHTDLEVAS